MKPVCCLQTSGKEANDKDTNGNDNFDRNLFVLVQHSKIRISCFDLLSQNT